MNNHNFVEQSNSIPLLESVTHLFASRMHRLHHALWHGLRDEWDKLSESKKKEIENLNWVPPRPALKHLRGGWMPYTKNGSGIDFLYMHREMILEFDNAMIASNNDPNIGWDVIPEPGRYKEFAIPNEWELPENLKWLERRFKIVKSDDFYWSRMRWWDRQFHDHSFLNKITLGELGALLETSVHNDMHMRWASQPKDPENGNLLSLGREPNDINKKWDAVEYNFLGETYSSHVNPIFWRLHKWVDSIIDEWYLAHKNISDTRVKTVKLNSIDWFEKGEWVEINDPWSSPSMHAHHDVSTMEKVYKILFESTSLTKSMINSEIPSNWFK
ncbi:hypothetical protein GXP67_00935 [Rhodocytophaga rosea]|uniref:Tyrosinase copper-binding domain-containing protein n=1 Tax=Rhodocytophaga rosea TaxID=2704465 RepID=A0A6C0GBR7_9BACT|nr:hypothetical protein [Rhodocytophaga rosea]QHT65337.1 hypothetical protein GXP67_00935 [Rhodocytophaga rosea]